MSLLHPNKISTTFLLVIIPTMVLATVLQIIVAAYTAYLEDHKNLETRIGLLSQEYSNILAKPLWNVDDRRVQQLLNVIQLDKDVAGSVVFSEDFSHFGSNGILAGMSYEDVNTLFLQVKQL